MATRFHLIPFKENINETRSLEKQKELLLGWIDVAGRQEPLDEAEEDFNLGLFSLIIGHCEDPDAMRKEILEIAEQKRGKDT